MGGAQCAAAERREKNGRKASYTADEDPVGQFDMSQAGKVREQIFWCSRNQEQQKENALHFVVVFQKFNRIEFFFADEKLDEFCAEFSHKQENGHAGHGGGKITDQASLPDTESVAGSNLEGASGNDSGENLKHDHANKGENSEKSFFFYPYLKLSGIGNQRYHRFADKISDHK